MLCSRSPEAARGGSHSDPRLWQRAEVTPGDTVSVTRGWEGPGQTQGTLLRSDFSQTLLELRQRQSCAPGALAVVAAGHGATRDGERVAVGARRSPGKVPSRGVMQAAALVWSRGRSPRSCRLVCGAGGPARLCRPRSLPALPVPNCGRGRQELQALLCQQPPGGKDPSSFSRQPWAASRTRLERVEAVAGAGRSWQCHSGSPRPRG